MTYEATIPITYEADWIEDSPVPRQREDHCKGKKVITHNYCNMLKNLSDLGDLANREFVTLAENWNTKFFQKLTADKNHIRRAREIESIGNFFSWCCNIATQRKLDALTMSEKKLEGNMDKVNAGLQQSLRLIADTSGKMARANAQTVEAFKEMEGKVKHIQNYLNAFKVSAAQNENELWGLAGILLKYQYDSEIRFIQLVREIKKQEILGHCKKNLIPPAVVSPDVLHEDLVSLEKELNEVRQGLAIPTGELIKMYQLPVCECTITGHRIIIHVKVPITRKAISCLRASRSAVQLGTQNRHN